MRYLLLSIGLVGDMETGGKGMLSGHSDVEVPREDAFMEASVRPSAIQFVESARLVINTNYCLSVILLL